MRSAGRAIILSLAARALSLRGASQSDGDRILVIRPDHLGDVLFLTPALRLLREARPNGELSVLVGPWAAGLLAGNPHIDKVETVDFPWFDRRPKSGPLDPYHRLFAAARLLQGRYDTAIVARFDHWWGAWMAAAARIPRIIGYDVPAVAPFLTDRLLYVPGHHEVVQNARLIGALGAAPSPTPSQYPLRFEITNEHRHEARTVLGTSGLRPAAGPLVAIHPGSGSVVKRWTPEQWGRLMDALHAAYGAQFVITGGTAEVLLAAKVARAGQAAPAVSVAGETTLPVLAALFERCALAIGPDSGPLHLAVAAGCPTVHLYGPVDPKSFGPWGDPSYHVVVNQSLACQPCNRLDWSESDVPDHPCVSGIPMPWVLDAAGRLMERKRAEQAETSEQQGN